MPLWSALLLTLGLAYGENAGFLTLPTGENVPARVQAQRAGAGNLVVDADGLQLLLAPDPDKGGFRIVGTRYLDGTALKSGVDTDGEVLAPATPDGDWQVKLRRVKFEASPTLPVAAQLSFAIPVSAESAGERERRDRTRAAMMTRSEKIGALLMKPLGPADLDSHADDIASGRLRGVLLKWDQFTPESAREFNAKLQALAGGTVENPKVLISIDHEPGAVFSQRKQGTTFPGAMALGAAGDVSLTERSARATARELRGQAHLNFGTVADVNVNPDNPIIGPRSFGEDVNAVAAHVVASVRGYQGTGVEPVIKHFPGHGDTAVDSHTGLPVVNRSLEELEKQELAPFRASVQAGAKALMTAHILFPALDPDLPATLSAKTIDYLRMKMGFQGALISDSMEMGAITKRWGQNEASALAVAAGIDILLMGKQDHKAVHEALVKAVASGQITEERLEEAVLRVLALRERVSGVAPEPPDDKELAEHRKLADEIAEKAVTLVRDPGGSLPLKAESGRILAVVAHNGRFDGEAGLFFEELRRRRADTASEIVAFRPTEEARKKVLKAAEAADIVVFGSYHWGAAEVKEQVQLMKALSALGKKFVLVSFMSPYDARFAPADAAVLSVYGLTTPGVRAAAKVLFGEIEAKGKSPVTIPGGRTEL